MFKKFIVLVPLFINICTANASPEQFKVGVIIPLTGPAADYGVAVKNGIELAQEENLHSKIKFIYEDGAYDPASVLSAFNRLYQIDKVDMLYVWGVKYCFLVSDYVEKYKLPTIAQCVHGEVAKDKKYIIRFLNYSDEYMEVLNKYILQAQYKNIATVVSDDTYCEETFKSFKENLDKSITINEIASFNPHDMDFRSAITKIKAKKFSAVVTFLAPGQNGLFAKQAREMSLNLPAIGHNTYESYSEIKLSQGSLNGTVFANNKVSKEFREIYLKKFQNDNQITWAGFSYEFVKMLSFFENQLLNTKSSLDIMKLIATYQKRGNSVVGEIKFYDNPKVGKYFGFPIVMKTIKDNKAIELE